MSSNISTTGINTSYPIAGQDNDTQGFRDNFSSIKYNLTTAATEITALQANVSGFGTNIAVLQSAVSGYAGYLIEVPGIISNVSIIQTQLVNGSFANITLTSALSLANISTTQRASISPSNGMLIYNNTYNKFQGYANGVWGNITLS